MVVAPATRGQGLQFQVGEVVFQELPLAGGDVAGVVEDGHVGVHLLDGGGGELVVALQSLLGDLEKMVGVVGVQALFPEALHAVFAGAGSLVDDVQEDAVAVGELAEDLLDFLAEMLHIGGVEAGLVEAGIQVALGHGGHGLQVHMDGQPLRMLRQHGVVQPRREIDGGVDVDFLAGVELCPEEVEGEAGVAVSHFGVVVVPAMVAFGEEGDGVHVGFLEGFLPLPLLETCPDAGDLAGGVEVQVDLAEAEGVLFHGKGGPEGKGKV